MRIIIDADGCPVTCIAIDLAKQKNIPVVIVCDISHEFSDDYAEVITVDKGADSADFKIANMTNADDIVITQDYGLAAMCLSKKSEVLNQDGMIYTSDNIDSLLLSRHMAKKIRNSGGRLKGPSKRTKQQDKEFISVLLSIIDR
ncbi:MAG: YaiI/YqxD family protein [Oscillospiraceae bacterium]